MNRAVHALVRRARRAEPGFTLIELLITVVLLSLVTGAISASLVSALSQSKSTVQNTRVTNDAQLIATYLTRDAQAAGGVEPLTGGTDSTLGASTDPVDATDCPGTGTFVARFTWIDRASALTATTHTAAYFYDAATTSLTRFSCTGSTVDSSVTLGRDVSNAPAPDATCNPAAACAVGGSGLPDTVSLTVAEVPPAGGTAYTYTLTASVRPEAQTAPDGSNSTSVPLLLLANGAGCPAGSALAMSATGGGSSTLRIYGTAAITGYSPDCPAVHFQGSIDYLASGGTTVLAPGDCSGTTCTQFTTPIVDPFATLAPPTASCGNGANPSPVGGHYPPGTYPQNLNISGTAVFDPGTYIFCKSLSVSGSLTSGAGGVLLYFVGTGSLSVTGNIDVSPQTTGRYAGLVLWQDKSDPTTLQVCCSNNAVASFRGTVYAPSAVVSLHNGTIYVRALIALAVSWSGGGNGGTSIGAIPPGLAIASPATLPDGTNGQPYPNTAVTATGGAGGNTWSATGLPAGLHIDGNGVISGTPTATGTFTVRVTVTDVFDNTATSPAYTLTIHPPLVINAPAALPGWTQGRAYPPTTLGATGGSGGYTWSATGLPAGLSLNPNTGLVSGGPTAAGTSSVTVTVTDAAGTTASRTYALTINPPPSITTTSLPDGEATIGYSQTVAATGGTAAYAWSATGLPAGLSINPATGAITGTPSATGTASVAVKVTDAAGATATATLSLAVYPKLTVTGPGTLPAWTVGHLYPGATASSTGGHGPYTWSATGLAAGLSINPATGAITGTPTTPCTCAVVLKITDSATPAMVATRSYTLTINAPPAITTTDASVKKKKAFTVTLNATGGTAPTWSMAAAPAWVALDGATGSLTGTAPNSPGTFTFTVTVTDATGATDTATFTLTVN
jgi:prepilin-type N-terminal cleavage/methylation domain-containing protein